MFKYELDEAVGLVDSDEHGIIIGRAQYAKGNEEQYLIRYKAGDGRQVVVGGVCYL